MCWWLCRKSVHVGDYQRVWDNNRNYHSASYARLDLLPPEPRQVNDCPQYSEIELHGTLLAVYCVDVLCCGLSVTLRGVAVFWCTCHVSWCQCRSNDRNDEDKFAKFEVLTAVCLKNHITTRGYIWRHVFRTFACSSHGKMPFTLHGHVPDTRLVILPRGSAVQRDGTSVCCRSVRDRTSCLAVISDWSAAYRNNEAV
jgi:hypothetical protein